MNRHTVSKPHGDSPPPGIDWGAALYEHRGWLRKVMLCRLNDPHVIDDLMQEMAVAVLKPGPRPRDPGKVAPWLYRLALRFAINYLRRRGRFRNLVQRCGQARASAGAAAIDPLEWLIDREQQDRVGDAIQSLRPQDREILMLKYTERWTYGQLAAHLGVSLECIEYRLWQARQRLRARLGTMQQRETVP